jgi:hypothetical protein
MSAHAQPGLTPEEYLEIERAAEFRSEYYAGRMYAMSGASLNHVLIREVLTLNSVLLLRRAPAWSAALVCDCGFRPRGCTPIRTLS